MLQRKQPLFQKEFVDKLATVSDMDVGALGKYEGSLNQSSFDQSMLDVRKKARAMKIGSGSVSRS